MQYEQHYQLRNIPVPKPGPNDLLVKVAAAGFCHIDYQVYSGTYNSVCPLTPSHEPVGTIVTIGAEAEKERKWHIGQRVGVLNFRHPCGHCSGCRWSSKKQGNFDARFCEKKDMAGIKTDGGFAEYIIADPATTVPLPDSISFDQAAPFMCAGVSAAKRTCVRNAQISNVTRQQYGVA
jgi:D-arabinose 1-dehydrogenase-like Zn-dependent alcohol dehydrogenase